MKVIEDILKWLELANIPQIGDNQQFELFAKLFKEEWDELVEGVKNNDKWEQADAIGDLIWIACNWAYMNKLPILQILPLINESNYSKFCTTVEDAIETINAYMTGTHWDKEGVIIDCYYEQVGDYYIVKSKTGKILKSIKYKNVNSLK